MLTHYAKEVVTIPAAASCHEIATKLKQEAVGCLVVVAEGRPVGILTDRDLLTRVIAAGRDTGATVARDVMSEPLVTVDPERPLERVVDAMAANSIRRVPVVRDGELVGIVSLDDLLVALSGELSDVAHGARRGFASAQRRAEAGRLLRELDERLRDFGDELERLGGDAKRKLTEQLDALGDRIRGRGD